MDSRPESKSRSSSAYKANGPPRRSCKRNPRRCHFPAAQPNGGASASLATGAASAPGLDFNRILRQTSPSPRPRCAQPRPGFAVTAPQSLTYSRSSSRRASVGKNRLTSGRNDRTRLSAGALLEQLGARGGQVGAVVLHTRTCHSHVLARAAHVTMLAVGSL